MGSCPGLRRPVLAMANTFHLCPAGSTPIPNLFVTYTKNKGDQCFPCINRVEYGPHENTRFTSQLRDWVRKSRHKFFSCIPKKFVKKYATRVQGFFQFIITNFPINLDKFK
jgi:hypothetical protein